MSESTYRRAIRGLCVAVVVGLGGCGTFIAPLEDIPPLLKLALDDEATYCAAVPADTNGLEPVTADDLGGTCWVTCGLISRRPSKAGVWRSRRRCVSTRRGGLERFHYESIPLLVRFVDVQHGTVLDFTGDSATFDVSQILSTLKTGRLVDDSADYANLPLYDVTWGMDGAHLVARFKERGTPRTAAGFADVFDMRHTRVPCP